MALLDFLNRIRTAVREDASGELQRAAQTITHRPEEPPEHWTPTKGHARTARALTEVLNTGGMPQGLAGGLANLAGYGNEALTGGGEALGNAEDLLAGRDPSHRVVGEAGWDPEDVKANQAGILRAMRGEDLSPGWARAAWSTTARLAPGSIPGAVYNFTEQTLPLVGALGAKAENYLRDTLPSQLEGAASGLASDLWNRAVGQAAPDNPEVQRFNQSSAGPYSPDQVKSLLGALGAAAARLGLK